MLLALLATVLGGASERYCDLYITADTAHFLTDGFCVTPEINIDGIWRYSSLDIPVAEKSR